MNQITPEQLLIKIGILTMENDILRAEIGKLRQEKIQKEPEKDSKKEK